MERRIAVLKPREARGKEAGRLAPRETVAPLEGRRHSTCSAVMGCIMIRTIERTPCNETISMMRRRKHFKEASAVEPSP